MKKTSFISGVFLTFAACCCNGFLLAQHQSVGLSAATDSLSNLPSLHAAVLGSSLAFRQNNITLPPEHRALFCRLDDSLDKKKIPLRMRLGSLEAVNTKEQKPGYRLPKLHEDQ